MSVAQPCFFVLTAPLIPSVYQVMMREIRKMREEVDELKTLIKEEFKRVGDDETEV